MDRNIAISISAADTIKRCESIETYYISSYFMLF